MISGYCGFVATVEVKLKALRMEMHEDSFTPWDFGAKGVSRQTKVKMHMREATLMTA